MVLDTVCRGQGGVGPGEHQPGLPDLGAGVLPQQGGSQVLGGGGQLQDTELLQHVDHDHAGHCDQSTRVSGQWGGAQSQVRHHDVTVASRGNFQVQHFAKLDHLINHIF